MNFHLSTRTYHSILCTLSIVWHMSSFCGLTFALRFFFSKIDYNNNSGSCSGSSGVSLTYKDIVLRAQFYIGWKLYEYVVETMSTIIRACHRPWSANRSIYVGLQRMMARFSPRNRHAVGNLSATRRPHYIYSKYKGRFQLCPMLGVKLPV